MSTMHKQSITFTAPQIDFLRLDAEQLGISVGELVRRIIDAYRETKGKS